MSMSLGSSSDEPMVDINTTPLIDVMLVLLVTLIITLPKLTHSTKLDLPQGHPPPPPVQPEVINLGIDFDGTITWNGTVVPNMQTLDAYFASETDKEPQPEIHLNPDGMAKYGVVAKVLADAQRNRMTKIGFVNTSEFSE